MKKSTNIAPDANTLENTNAEEASQSNNFCLAADGSLPQILTHNELADLFGVSRNLLVKLREEGMPAIRIGKRYRYNILAVATWLEQRAYKYENQKEEKANEE